MRTASTELRSALNRPKKPEPPVVRAYQLWIVTPDLHWPVCLRRGGLSRRHLHLVIGIDEIVAGLGLVAVEAAVQICVRVGRLVGAEGLVLPFAIALRLGVFAAPPGLLLHHRITLDRVRLHEAAVRVLRRIALGIELGGVL